MMDFQGFVSLLRLFDACVSSSLFPLPSYRYTKLMKPHTRTGWIVVLLLLAPYWAAAQDTAPGAFARAGFGARGIAMGNALAADLSGDASPYYNPALAAYHTGQHLSASAAFLSMDRELQFLQFATPIEPSAGLAVGLIHAGVNDIDGRDASGYHTETLSTDEFALSMAFGNRFGERLAAGTALKLYHTDLLDTVPPPLTLGLDAGVTYAVTPMLHVGFVVSDLLARYSWDTSSAFEDGRSTTDRFPVRLRLGGMYRLLADRLHLTAEYESRFTERQQRVRVPSTAGTSVQNAFETQTLTLHSSRLRIGASYRFVDTFTARAGLNRIGTDGVSSLQPSAGFDVKQPIGNLDVRAAYAVAFEPYVRDDMHLLSLHIFL